MAQRSKKLFAPALLTAAFATYYTATSVRAKNLWLTVTNTTATAYLVTIAIVPSGGAASNTNTVTYQRTVLPGQTVVFYELCGHVLDNGDFISAKADTNAVVSFAGSGDEVSI